MQARRKQLPDQLQGLWSDVPAWTATMLFMFQPVAQSVSSLLVSSLHGAALCSVLLFGMCTHTYLAVVTSKQLHLHCAHCWFIFWGHNVKLHDVNSQRHLLQVGSGSAPLYYIVTWV